MVRFVNDFLFIYFFPFFVIVGCTLELGYFQAKR